MSNALTERQAAQRDRLLAICEAARHYIDVARFYEAMAHVRHPEDSSAAQDMDNAFDALAAFFPVEGPKEEL